MFVGLENVHDFSNMFAYRKRFRIWKTTVLEIKKVHELKSSDEVEQNFAYLKNVPELKNILLNKKLFMTYRMVF